MQTRFLILQIADFGLFSRAFVLPKYEKTKKANSCKKVYFCGFQAIPWLTLPGAGSGEAL